MVIEVLYAEHSGLLSTRKPHPYIAELNQPRWGLSGLFRVFPKLGVLLTPFLNTIEITASVQGVETRPMAATDRFPKARGVQPGLALTDMNARDNLDGCCNFSP